MSYVIKAYSKNSKLNIPVEDKHVYKTTQDTRNYINQDIITATKKLNLIPYTAAFETGSTGGFQAYRASEQEKNIELLFNGANDLTVAKGTNPEQRIGDKVYLKHMTMLINIDMTESAKRFFNNQKFNYSNLSNITNLDNFTDNLSEESITPAKFKFRLLLVYFDNDSIDLAGIRDWFNTSFVPQYYISTTTTTKNSAVSNQSKILRESTSYTGKFKILSDKSFTLNSKKGHKFIKFDWDFKTNLTMDTNNLPTDAKFKNTRLILLAPTLLKNDMDGNSFSKFSHYMAKTASESTAALLRSFVIDAFQVSTNIKFKYYDI